MTYALYLELSSALIEARVWLESAATVLEGAGYTIMAPLMKDRAKMADLALDHMQREFFEEQWGKLGMTPPTDREEAA